MIFVELVAKWVFKFKGWSYNSRIWGIYLCDKLTFNYLIYVAIFMFILNIYIYLIIFNYLKFLRNSCNVGRESPQENMREKSLGLIQVVEAVRCASVKFLTNYYLI